MSKIVVVRIDDGVRAKLLCAFCGAETYVPLFQEVGPTTPGQMAATLVAVVDNHVCR